MLSCALSLYISMAFAARIGHACMAMQPNPRPTTTTSAPDTTTTTASPETTTTTISTTSSTTSSTTTTTTTTTAITCLSCTAPKFMAAACGASFICNDETLLTTVQMPCVGATCAMGSTLMGVQSGMPEVAISAMGIKCKPDGVSFEDAGDPTKVFPAATSTFYCKKLSCEIPKPSAMCAPADVGSTCALVEVTAEGSLSCPTPRTLQINDAPQTMRIVCTSGVWMAFAPIPAPFTAYCK